MVMAHDNNDCLNLVVRIYKPTIMRLAGAFIPHEIFLLAKVINVSPSRCMPHRKDNISSCSMLRTRSMLWITINYSENSVDWLLTWLDQQRIILLLFNCKFIGEKTKRRWLKSSITWWEKWHMPKVCEIVLFVCLSKRFLFTNWSP